MKMQRGKVFEFFDGVDKRHELMANMSNSLFMQAKI